MISIIMPAFNCELFVAAAIDSVLAQTIGDWELLIADDGSTDSTRRIIDVYAEKDQRIKTFHNESNAGIVRTRNNLFRHVSGDFITLLDADDRMAPEKLEKQVGYMLREGLEAAGVNYSIATMDGETIVNTQGRFNNILRMDDIDELPFWPPSIMVTRSLLNRVGGYHPYFEDMACYEDKYWLLDILEHSEIGFLNEPLYYYRHNPASVTKTLNFKRLAGQELVKKLIKQRLESGEDWLTSKEYKKADEFVKVYLNDRKWQAECYRIYAAIRTDEANYSNAFYLLKKAFAVYPLNPRYLNTLFYLSRAVLKLK